MGGHVYILASRRYGTLYTGVTSDLARRVGEHRDGAVPGFTREYNVKRLVFFESHDDIRDAIAREKRIKEWKRDWKIALIERDNPLWDDLAVTMLGFPPLPSHDRSRHPGEGRDP
ncbi:GIY-YIG nuclease family protein [Rhizorhabdus argentea]|uniref:GIY-YIG nuclease family protein n=1 Tax=Rhizorhabdus argentea TaxID=1387174 RepID=UPI0030ED3059